MSFFSFMRVACLGFSSGLPYFLVISSLTLWLADVGLSYAAIGLLSWTSLPYVLKIFFSPFVDVVSWPYLTKYLGQRRSWGLVMQLIIIGSIYSLSLIDPVQQFGLLWVNCLILLTAAALQDTVLEAYRIEMTPLASVGILSSASYFGFRIGMWSSGYLCFLLSDLFSWRFSFRCMSVLMGIGLMGLLCCRESVLPSKQIRYTMDGFFDVLKQTALSVWKTWPLFSIAIFLFSFKLGDIFIRSLWAPFLLTLGYSKIHIAQVDKLIGISAMMLGGLLGGFLIAYWGLSRTLKIWGGLQTLGALLFLAQALVGQHKALFMTSMIINHLAGGIGGTALITYMSCLCHAPYTAIQYAALSSFGSLCRILVTVFSSWCADHLSWTSFFILGTVCSLLSWILVVSRGRLKNNKEHAV